MGDNKKMNENNPLNVLELIDILQLHNSAKVNIAFNEGGEFVCNIYSIKYDHKTNTVTLIPYQYVEETNLD